jgi:type 1 glutamine amidotransferase
MFNARKASSRTVRAGFAAVVALAIVLPATPAFAAKGGPATQIAAAIPPTATAKPKHPRRLLVFNTKKGHPQPASAAAKAIELMGEKTGAWTTTIAENPTIFDGDGLKPFDAVCINNTSVYNPFADELPRTATADERKAALAVTERREQAFLNYVRGGKGVIGFHGTTDSRSPMLSELFAGQFNGHPWLANETVGVRIDDPRHVLTACFAGAPFMVKDEIYEFTDKWHAGFRAKLRVLLTLDMTTTANKGKRADQDYAVAWIRKVGEGRLFYSSLGHNQDIFWDPRLLRFYQDGIQFALGDLDADMKPSTEVGLGRPGPTSQPAR